MRGLLKELRKRYFNGGKSRQDLVFKTSISMVL
jgi:hypothetical protein